MSVSETALKSYFKLELPIIEQTTSILIILCSYSLYKDCYILEHIVREYIIQKKKQIYELMNLHICNLL